MQRQDIELDSFNTNIFQVLNKSWMLLTGGSYELNEFNPMTVSWGFMGTFWFRPLVIAGVRPQRYTWQFMERHNSFTLCALPPEMRQILDFCGSKSGRDYDKIRECGLTPVKSQKIEAPGYDEAELIIECRKVYADNLNGKNFLDKSIIPKCYPERDFHRLYFGQVIRIEGIDKYRHSTKP